MGIKCTLAGVGAQALRMFPRPGTACPPRCSPAERALGSSAVPGTGACGPGLSWVPGMVERGERRGKESQGERSGKEDGRKKGKKEGRRGKCVGLHVTPSKKRIEC